MGIMTVQYAICEGVVYIIEANPRASRTVPVVSKVTGVPLANTGDRTDAGEDPCGMRENQALRQTSSSA